MDKAAFEGVYLFSGEPIHASNSPFNTKLSFNVEIRLDCNNDVVIGSTPLKFHIKPPATAGMPELSESDALFHWMGEEQSYTITGFTNPHPYSCNLAERLIEIEQDTAGNAVLNPSTSNPNETTPRELFITLAVSVSASTINVSSKYNEFFTIGKTNGNEILMMYEASLLASTKKERIIFKYFIFKDCSSSNTSSSLPT